MSRMCGLSPLEESWMRDEWSWKWGCNLWEMNTLKSLDLNIRSILNRCAYILAMYSVHILYFVIFLFITFILVYQFILVHITFDFISNLYNAIFYIMVLYHFCCLIIISDSMYVKTCRNNLRPFHPFVSVGILNRWFLVTPLKDWGIGLVQNLVRTSNTLDTWFVSGFLTPIHSIL